MGASPSALIWDGKTFVPAGPMPTDAAKVTSTSAAARLPDAILTLPDAGGTFAVTRDLRVEANSSLWFRPTGGDWTQIADGAALDRLATGLHFPASLQEADVAPDGQTVRLFAARPGEASVLLRKTAIGWTLDSAAPYQDWVTHMASGIRLAWVGKQEQILIERRLFVFTRPVQPQPPVLHALDPGTLVSRPLPGITPAATITPQVALYWLRPVALPGRDPLLVAAADGWHAFDGTTLTALPSLRAETVGDLSEISQIGPLSLLQSKNGIFTLDETLIARPVPGFPVAEPSSAKVEITHLAAPGLFVAVERHSPRLHISTDFTRFQTLQSPVPITSIVAPLPDRPALLLVGTGGLYTFEADCPK